MPAALQHSPYARTKPPAGSQIDWGHPLARGLVGLWPLNEGSGLAATNLAAPTLGTVTGGATWTPDPLGKGMKFDGSTGYIVNPYVQALNCTSGITIEALVRMGSITGHVIIGKPFASTHTTPFFDWLMWDDGSFRIGAVAVTNSVIAANTFGHWVLTADGATWRWYVNGRLFTTSAQTALPTNTNSQGVRIGTRAGAAGEFFDGYVFKTSVYNRPLSGSEVARLYAEPYAMLRGSDVYRRIGPDLSGIRRLVPGEIEAGKLVNAGLVG